VGNLHPYHRSRVCCASVWGTGRPRWAGRLFLWVLLWRASPAPAELLPCRGPSRSSMTRTAPSWPLPVSPSCKGKFPTARSSSFPSCGPIPHTALLPCERTRYVRGCLFLRLLFPQSSMHRDGTCCPVFRPHCCTVREAHRIDCSNFHAGGEEKCSCVTYHPALSVYRNIL